MSALQPLAHARPSASDELRRPILDVARGVTAGFCVGPVEGPLRPDRLAAVLDSTEAPPRNTFLMLPVELSELSSPAVRAALLRPSTLTGFVFDIVGELPATLDDGVARALQDLRDSGGLVAIAGLDDAQPSVRAIAALQPAFILLGRAWVDGIESAPDKRATVRRVGRLASDLDAWIAADHVRTAGELTALAELEVPLAAGPFVGIGEPDWPSLNPAVVHALSSVRRSDLPGQLRSLLVRTPAVFLDSDAAELLEHRRDLRHVVVVDANRRPLSLATAGESRLVRFAPIMKVNADEDTGVATRRAAARPARTRLDPVALTDAAGRFLGLVTLT